MTLAEVVKQQDYATACYGKWHLGHHPKFLPTQPRLRRVLRPALLERHVAVSSDRRKALSRRCRSSRATRVIDADVTDADQTQLTTWYTEHAVRFIEKNKERPFFLYLPHSMVHVPLHVSDKFQGKSERGCSAT